MALRGASCTRLANSEDERRADTENLTVSGIYLWVMGFISPLDILPGRALLSRNKVEGLSCPRTYAHGAGLTCLPADTRSPGPTWLSQCPSLCHVDTELLLLLC